MQQKNSIHVTRIKLFIVLVTTIFCLESKALHLNHTKAPRQSNSPSVVGGLITSCNNNNLEQAIKTIDSDLTQCCNDLKNDFNGTFTTLNLISNLLSATVCGGIPITGPTIITESGYYCVAQDIEGQIIIDTNNVVLDLNNHRITTNSIGDAIVVNSGINRVIKNGIIANSEWAIVLDGNATTEVSNIIISFCSVGGILAINSINLTIQSISMESATIGCFFSQSNNGNLLRDIFICQSQEGMIFENLVNSVIQNCHVVDGDNPDFPFAGPSNYGFGLLSGNNIQFDNCSVQRYTAIFSSSGFFIDESTDVVLRNCLAQTIASQFPFDFGIGQGFWCTELTNNVQLLNCSALDISGTTSSNGFVLLGNDIVTDSCITQSCVTTFTPQIAYGFICSGSGIALTDCQAYNAYEGFYLTTPVVAQNCQSSFNVNGFTIFDPTSIIGNCRALNNSIGFNASSLGFVHNCFAANNTLLNYLNVPNVQNANAQVDTTIVGPSGPIAGGNLFM